MTFKEKCRLLRVSNALDGVLGDTDPDCGDMTDEEIRSEEPLLWAAMQISTLLGPGPWDKYTSPSRTPITEEDNNERDN